MTLPSWLSDAGATARRFLPSGDGGAQQPAAFVASEPGGASAPLIWIVIMFCVELAVIVALAAAGWKPAQWFCEPSRLLAFSSLLGVLVPSLVAYRSFNKHTAAKVAISEHAASVAIAQAQAPAAAPEARP
jgi:hypothetical protein